MFLRVFPNFSSHCVTPGGCPLSYCYSGVLKRGGQPAASHWKHVLIIRAGGCCHSSALLNIKKKEKQPKIWRNFLPRIFNKTNHYILQAFPSTLKISPKFSSYFNCCNFPRQPEIRLYEKNKEPLLTQYLSTAIVSPL